VASCLPDGRLARHLIIPWKRNTGGLGFLSSPSCTLSALKSGPGLGCGVSQLLATGPWSQGSLGKQMGGETNLSKHMRLLEPALL
jgi:hypothetical protein